MIVLSKIQDEVTEDLKFDIVDADKHALRLSSLRDKYARLAVLAELERARAETEMKKAYHVAWDFYMLKIPQKMDRRDVDIKIEADEDYVKAKSVHEYAKQVVKYVDNVMQSLDRASYNIGNAIKWAIFKAGG